jgi:leucyl aminopeptidase
MKFEYSSQSYTEIACDLLVYPIFEEETMEAKALEALHKATRGITKSVLESGEFKTELHRTCLIHKPAGIARLRELAGTAVRSTRSGSCKSAAFLRRGSQPIGDAAQVIAEGALYGSYESDLHKTREKEECHLERLLLSLEKPGGAKEAIAGLRRGEIVGNAINLARSLADEPANILTPSQFAERAIAAGKEAGLDVEVLEREDMAKLGMNTFLAVARGSAEPPKLIILKIANQKRRSKSKSPLYAFIGKGVTFDSGGISIKPAEKMEEMKADMAGGAAVLGAMVALAQLNPKRQVIGLIPAVENLPGGRATKPGDVVKSLLGKTVEIINTDAEGRLIMADALAYARTLGATHLVDIATLTGACVIALGSVNAGMMGTDQALMDRMRRNCSFTGERLWQLPLDEEYRKAIRSEIADMKNVGNRKAGAITAAKFLQEFAEDTPWVHLDIAGVDLDLDGRPFAAKGSTGFGVRTLTQLLL